MSLRGSETTEAISKSAENKGIATHPLGARNDRIQILGHPGKENICF